MKTYIDNSLFLELVSEIAEEITKVEFKEETHRLDVNGDWVLRDGAQDYFNVRYDQIESMFNHIANIYSNEEHNQIQSH